MYNDFILDKKELDELKKINFNKLDFVFNSFFNEFQDKLESRHLLLIKKIIKKIKTSNSPNINPGVKQYYKRDILFKGDNFYRMYWDISLAEIVINKYGIKPQRVNVDMLSDVVDTDYLIPDKIEKCLSFERIDPVFVVEFNPFNSCIVIDGNHRVISNKIQSKQYIDAYLIKDSYSMECMAGSVFKYLYAVHYNMTKLYNSIVDPEFEANLDEILIDEFLKRKVY